MKAWWAKQRKLLQVELPEGHRHLQCTPNRQGLLMRYWVYLGEHPEAGPFPTYDEAHRERTHLLTGLIIGGSPAIFKIRTDQFGDAPPIAHTKAAT